MPRSMWRGAIQFGLVTVPVKLYLATEARGGLSFNLLHKEDMQRIQMKIHCPVHGEIPRSETVRGFEYSKGQYVLIEESDFEKVPAEDGALDRDRARSSTPSAIRRFRCSPSRPTTWSPRRSGARPSTCSSRCSPTRGCRPSPRSSSRTARLWRPSIHTSRRCCSRRCTGRMRSAAYGELDLPEEEFDFKPAEKAMAAQLVEAMRGEFKRRELQGRVPRSPGQCYRGQDRRQAGSRGAQGRRNSHQDRRPDERPRGQRGRGARVAHQATGRRREGSRIWRRQGGVHQVRWQAGRGQEFGRRCKGCR